MRWAAAGLVLLAACNVEEAVSDPPVAETAQTEAWTLQSTTLYMPVEEIDRRIDSTALVGYINALRATANTEFSRRPGLGGLSGAVVVVARPGRQSRVWLVTGDPMNAQMREWIEGGLEAVPVPDVTGGPVVFGLLFSAWGGGAPPPGLPMPTPSEWQSIGEEGRWMDDSFYNDAWTLRE